MFNNNQYTQDIINAATKAGINVTGFEEFQGNELTLHAEVEDKACFLNVMFDVESNKFNAKCGVESNGSTHFYTEVDSSIIGMGDALSKVGNELSDYIGANKAAKIKELMQLEQSLDWIIGGSYDVDGTCHDYEGGILHYFVVNAIGNLYISLADDGKVVVEGIISRADRNKNWMPLGCLKISETCYREDVAETVAIVIGAMEAAYNVDSEKKIEQSRG